MANIHRILLATINFHHCFLIDINRNPSHITFAFAFSTKANHEMFYFLCWPGLASLKVSCYSSKNYTLMIREGQPWCSHCCYDLNNSCKKSKKLLIFYFPDFQTPPRFDALSDHYPIKPVDYNILFFSSTFLFKN